MFLMPQQCIIPQLKVNGHVVFKKKGVKFVNARRKTNYRNHLNDQGELNYQRFG